MISLYQFGLECACALAPENPVSAILDVAYFYRWKDEQDGSRTAYFILRKCIPGHARGTVLSLRQLHEALVGKALK